MKAGAVPILSFFCLTIFAQSAMADFVINTKGKYGATGHTNKNRELLVNKSTIHLEQIGKGSASLVGSSVEKMPLSDAMALLLPEGWSAYGSGVDFDDKHVDVFAGEPWTKVFERAGNDHNLIFTLNWPEKEMTVRPDLAIGSYDNALAEFDGGGLFNDASTNASGASGDQAIRLYLPEGDLFQSLGSFALTHSKKLIIDRYGPRRDIELHPSVASEFHPVPECIAWTIPKAYEKQTNAWLVDINRVLKPYRLTIVGFDNDVLFLTSTHEYEDTICVGDNNE